MNHMVIDLSESQPLEEEPIGTKSAYNLPNRPASSRINNENDDEDNDDYFNEDIFSAYNPNKSPIKQSSRLLRKSVNRILELYPELSREFVESKVEKVIQSNPLVREINQMVQRTIDSINDIEENDDVIYLDNQFSSNHDDIFEINSFPQTKIVNVDPVLEIKKIFPLAKKDFIKKQLMKHGLIENSYPLDTPEISSILQEMAEKGYEKEDTPAITETIKTDFLSKTWTTPDVYRTNALTELSYNFQFIKSISIEKVFAHEEFHYYHTLQLLEKITGTFAYLYQRVFDIIDVDLISNNSNKSSTKATNKKNDLHSLNHSINTDIKKFTYNNDEINQINTATDSFFQSYKASDEKKCLTRQSMCYRKTTNQAINIGNKIHPILIEEIQFVIDQKRKDLEAKDFELATEINNVMAEEEGVLFECGCCYIEYSFESMIQCSEGHLFCKKCIQSYVEEMIFGNNNSTLTCISSSEKCNGTFPQSMLQLALPEKTFERYSTLMTQNELKKANVNNLGTCYNCHFQAEVSDGKVLHCPQCNRETCVECGEVAHIPLKCNEVEKKKDTNKRLSVEEAMTQARIRECPKCKTRFFKTEGCNKMTCSCGINICYTCRKDITKEGYSHFCQIPHCNHSTCKGCKLYSNSIEDDRLAMLEAGIQQLRKDSDSPTESTTSGSKEKQIEGVRIFISFTKFIILFLFS